MCSRNTLCLFLFSLSLLPDILPLFLPIYFKPTFSSYIYSIMSCRNFWKMRYRCPGEETWSRHIINKNRIVVEVKSYIRTYNEEKKKSTNHIISSSYYLKSVILGRKFTFPYIYVLFEFLKVYALLLWSE